jgi:hypothetical protein
VFHDVNVYPTRTRLDVEGRVTLAPVVSSIVVSDPLPPSVTKFTVTVDVELDDEPDGFDVGGVTSVHCAYSVIDDDKVIVWPGSKEVPEPFAAVFHELSAYPVSSTFIALGNVTADPTAPLSIDIELAPPLALIDISICGS